MNYLQSKHLWTALLTCCLIYVASCQDKKNDPFNENNYKEVRRGKYRETELYAIVLQNKSDTQYTLVKMFNDSSYNPNFYIQHYEYKALMDGPLESFISGKSGGKKFYKQGKRHGEGVSLRSDGTIAEKQFYNMGKKVGVWEFYDSYGRIFKKKYYNDNNFVKQEIYNREGKLVRTELEESTSY